MIVVLSNYTETAGKLAAKLRFLLFSDSHVPLATRFDYNFEKGRYLGEVEKNYKTSIEYLDKNIVGAEPHLPSLFAAASSRIRGNIEIEKAISLLEKYLELNPGASKNTLTAVWWFKGQGYEKLRDFSRAADCYRKSLEISSDFDRAKNSLRDLEKKSGTIEKHE